MIHWSVNTTAPPVNDCTGTSSVALTVSRYTHRRFGCTWVGYMYSRSVELVLRVLSQVCSMLPCRPGGS